MSATRGPRGSFTEPRRRRLFAAMQSAVNYAWQHNVLVVAAAGTAPAALVFRPAQTTRSAFSHRLGIISLRFRTSGNAVDIAGRRRHPVDLAYICFPHRRNKLWLVIGNFDGDAARVRRRRTRRHDHSQYFRGPRFCKESSRPRRRPPSAEGGAPASDMASSLFKALSGTLRTATNEASPDRS